jgi:hypothetical protein
MARARYRVRPLNRASGPRFRSGRVSGVHQQRAGPASDDMHRRRSPTDGIGYAWSGEMKVYRFPISDSRSRSQHPHPAVRPHAERGRMASLKVSSRVSPVRKSRSSAHSRRWLGHRERETFAFHNTIIRRRRLPIERRHLQVQVPSLRLILFSDSWSNSKYRAPSQAPHPGPASGAIVIVGAAPRRCVTRMRRNEVSELVD